MHFMYFTEQPMSAFPEKEARKYGSASTLFPNKFFNPPEGSRLYEERLAEYLYAEEMGFDGIMLNEHHNTVFCMQAKINIFAGILAAMTKRVKIVLLGNPLPISDNPVRLAEELAMIDLISKGRLVSGFVRGGGTEQFATNANPAYNRERFAEAHDLIVKTWTQPGPFRWEGDHYQLRLVNPWVLPLQKPHPRIWIPGVISTETIVWAAEHRYPYVCLSAPVQVAQQIWRIYDVAAERSGYKAGPEQRGYNIACHVAETEEKALEHKKQFMWPYGDRVGGGNVAWGDPPGYNSPLTRRDRLAKAMKGEGALAQQLRGMSIISGTPDQVIKELRGILEETRPSILGLWANHGTVDHKDSMTCIRLLGQEVLPAVREIGQELELKSPFELNTPVSLSLTPRSELTPASGFSTGQ